jgi:hypothetical protein
MTARAFPNKVSLVFCDVDGTLVTKDKRLTPASKEAVALLRAAGIRFAVASSRPPKGLAAIAGALDLDMPLTAFNGGLIAERDGAVIDRHLVPRDAGQKAVQWLESAGAEVWVFTPDRWLVKDTGASYVAFEQRTVGFAPTPVLDFTPYLDEVGKIVGVSADFEFLANCETEMVNQLGAAASVARSQAYYLDITDPHANKAEALRRLAAHCDLPMEEIIAVGDGLNDIGMLREAAFAVAMGNAPETVKTVADFVTASNEEDGFAKAVSFILRACRHVEGALP